MTLTPLSARYFAALDAYEEVLILRDLRDRLDKANAWAARQRDEPPGTFYMTMGAETNSYMTSRLWYVEFSQVRLSEAERALKDAVESYKEALSSAALGRSDLMDSLRKLGLPSTSEVREMADDRPAIQPWWRPRKRTIGHFGLDPASFLREQPTGEKYVALNLPDPSAAVDYWRSPPKPLG